jgi:polysaccharide export outer membrane protein
MLRSGHRARALALSLVPAVVGVGLLLAASRCALAQKPPAYVLGPDDTIEVTVSDHPELTKTLIVMPDGKIAFPEVGEIVAAGKTPSALAADLKAALEKHRNNVNVVVTVVTPRSLRVRIVGAVKSPGVYDFRSGMRVLDLVALSGGLTSRPARVRARLLRTNGTVLELDMQEAVAKPETDANASLNVDDLVLIDEMDPLRNKAYVMGRVARPGAYELGDEGRALLAVLAEAGNPTEDAALSRCVLIRGNEETRIDLRPSLIQGSSDDATRAIILKPGDMVFVPRNEALISVMGSVQKSGQFSLPEDKPITVLDALGLAGGPTQTANPRDVSVVRMVEGTPSVMKVDLDRIMKKKDFAANIPLRKDDIVFVPAKGEKGFTVSDLLAPFTALYYLSRIGR